MTNDIKEHEIEYIHISKSNVIFLFMAMTIISFIALGAVLSSFTQNIWYMVWDGLTVIIMVHIYFELDI